MVYLSNLKIRTLTGIVFFSALLLISLLGGMRSFLIAFAVIIAVCGFEWACLCGLCKKKSSLFALTTIGIMSLAFMDNGNFILFGLAVLLPFVIILHLKYHQFGVIAGLVYLPFAGLSVVMFGIQFNKTNIFWGTIVIGLWILVIFVDVFAYVFGKLLGKNKLAPSISPGKTLEGFIGGVGSAGLLGYVVGTYINYPNIDAQHLSVVCVIIGVVAQLGDLYESKIKRTAGVKDSGKILPGHGGLLDRLDGYLAVMAFCGLFFVYNKALI